MNHIRLHYLALTADQLELLGFALASAKAVCRLSAATDEPAHPEGLADVRRIIERCSALERTLNVCAGRVREAGA